MQRTKTWLGYKLITLTDLKCKDIWNSKSRTSNMSFVVCFLSCLHIAFFGCNFILSTYLGWGKVSNGKNALKRASGLEFHLSTSLFNINSVLRWRFTSQQEGFQEKLSHPFIRVSPLISHAARANSPVRDIKAEQPLGETVSAEQLNHEDYGEHWQLNWFRCHSF